MAENEKNQTNSKKTNKSTKTEEIDKKDMARCKMPFSPNKVLDALMLTYPDDFPWGGDGVLIAITGGDVITVELGKVMT